MKVSVNQNYQQPHVKKAIRSSSMVRFAARRVEHPDVYDPNGQPASWTKRGLLAGGALLLSALALLGISQHGNDEAPTPVTTTTPTPVTTPTTTQPPPATTVPSDVMVVPREQTPVFPSADAVVPDAHHDADIVRFQPHQRTDGQLRNELAIFLLCKEDANLIQYQNTDTLLTRFDNELDADVIASAELQAAIYSWGGTVAQPVLEAITSDELAVRIDYDDALKSTAILATVQEEANGELVIRVNPNLQGEPVANIGLVVYEALMQGVMGNDDDASTTAAALSTRLFIEQQEASLDHVNQGELARLYNSRLVAFLNGGGIEAPSTALEDGIFPDGETNESFSEWVASRDDIAMVSSVDIDTQTATTLIQYTLSRLGISQGDNETLSQAILQGVDQSKLKQALES